MVPRWWARLSIEWKVPLLFGAVLLLVITALSSAAYVEARRAARGTAAERLATVTRQLQESLESSSHQAAARADSMADGGSLRAFLRGATPRRRSEAFQGLRYTGSQPDLVASIELWDTAGHRLLADGRAVDLIDTTQARQAVLSASGEGSGVGAFMAVGDTVLYPTIAPVRDGAARLGSLVLWRYVRTSPQALAQYNRLIGSEAAIYLGNRDGGVWTDLVRPVARPPVDVAAASGMLRYERPGAGERFATATAVAGTPWMLLVEFAGQAVLHPAALFLRRMVGLAAVFLVLGVAAAWWASREMTRPLRALAVAADALGRIDAAEGMGGTGEFPAVPADREDELGRVAEGFNRAAERVRHVLRHLEETVQARTVELRRALERLQDSEGHLFQILDALPVGVYVVDHEGKAYFANRQSQDILGRGVAPGAKAEDLADVYRAYRVGTDEPYPGHQQPIVAALRGQRAHAADFEIRRPDRAVRIEVWAAPVLGADASLAFAVAAFADITEREQARQEIERLNNELSRRVTDLELVNDELDTFCYSVSHDLRAPLRAIDGFSRILLEDHGNRLDDEGRRLLGVIRTNAAGMGRLIDDLLSFSRLSRKSLEPGTVDMKALVETIVEDCRTGAEAPARARVVIDELPKVSGDAMLLRQVWANLIGNALKFSRNQPNPVVEVGYLNGSEETVFFVRDNGVGFDMAYAGKLFGVFQRLHRPEEFEGTGVGLAIVERAVHRHGGRVWADAEPGRGATFSFAVPRTEA